LSSILNKAIVRCCMNWSSSLKKKMWCTHVVRKNIHCPNIAKFFIIWWATIVKLKILLSAKNLYINMTWLKYVRIIKINYNKVGEKQNSSPYNHPKMFVWRMYCGNLLMSPPRVSQHNVKDGSNLANRNNLPPWLIPKKITLCQIFLKPWFTDQL
jgi:hypothetical protein